MKANAYQQVLKKKTTTLLLQHADGRKLYSVEFSQAWLDKNMTGSFPFKRFPGIPGYEVKHRSEVTGVSTDKGYVIIDTTEQKR